MRFPKELTTVTPLSKYLAMVVFIALPFVGFFLGMRYQEMLNLTRRQQTEENLSITRIPTPTSPSGCYYKENPEAACPKKDCGKILICPTPTADETANWKIHNDKMNRFTFKYPPEFLIKEDVGGSGKVFYANLENSEEEFIKFEAGPSDQNGWFEHFKSNRTEDINSISWFVVPASEYCDAGECGPTAPGYYIQRNGYYVGASAFMEAQSLQTLKKILSTFKFTNQKEEQVMCTQEAKLCPDGKTSVGRTGPNCEFAPCP